MDGSRRGRPDRSPRAGPVRFAGRQTPVPVRQRLQFLAANALRKPPRLPRCGLEIRIALLKPNGKSDTHRGKHENLPKPPCLFDPRRRGDSPAGLRRFARRRAACSVARKARPFRSPHQRLLEGRRCVDAVVRRHGRDVALRVRRSASGPTVPDPASNDSSSPRNPTRPPG